MADLPAAFADAVAREVESGAVRDKETLKAAKQALAREHGLVKVPTDRDLAAAFSEEARGRMAALLRTKPTRSQSGVAVVAVMSSPAACPHGKCIFCPGGPDVGVPQSYTGHEPSTMRAIENGYDPYRIVRGRLAQLERNGHAVDKVDIVVQGGTFPARDVAYQDWFVAGIYAGLNAGLAEPRNPRNQGKGGFPMTVDSVDSTDSVAGWEAEADWRGLPQEERRRRLAALMHENESARCRAVGLTIETKPDWCLQPDVDRMLAYGCTRVEVGLQALDEEVLRFTHRGHGLAESRDALRIARDAGLKVCAHVMPGLPRLASPDRPGGREPDPEADVEDFRRLFAEEEWRPDMLKVYPTLVVEEGETGLKAMWRRGGYHPYGTAEAARVIAAGKAFVPEWCRIQRVDRDIPTTHVLAGVENSNLRQYVQAEMERSGTRCRCIRCREAARVPSPVEEARLVLVRRDYAASGGTEAFLSLEDPVADAVVGYLRLRRASAQAHRPETRVPGGAAFVRELKVHGIAQPLGAHDGAPGGTAWQHRGLGARLLGEAERIAFSEWGCGRLLVTAGAGVKAYYRKRGYCDCGPYVAKGAP